MSVVALVRGVHVLTGTIWAGAAVLVAVYILPAAKAAGPRGAAVLRQLTVVRKLPQTLLALAAVTVVSGAGVAALNRQTPPRAGALSYAVCVRSVACSLLIAFALCGTFRGGAAKVCIFASGLLGMMSGSIISNVLTAGTMTIPVMKKSGFRASYAGAIEACASTGAVLAPPVMGATAFVIAQFLNVSYADVAIAAIIPAALYYVGLFMQVDSYAARHGLKGIPRAELPKI